MSMHLAFEHKGVVTISQHSRVYGDLSHVARDLTVHLTGRHEKYDRALLFGFVESRFRSTIRFSIVPDGIRFCEVFARDGTRLFDSRALIPCEPAPVPKKVIPVHFHGKRPHPRHFRELWNG